MNKFTAVAFAAAFAVSPFDASARPPNYDESKVAPYALEDPLAFADGRKLSGPEEWPARRAEILGIFAKEMYGMEQRRHRLFAACKGGAARGGA